MKKEVGTHIEYNFAKGALTDLNATKDNVDYDTDVAANTEDDDILGMTLKELKVECLKRGLASRGTKEKLLLRLIPDYVKLMKPPILAKRLKMEEKLTPARNVVDVSRERGKAKRYAYVESASQKKNMK